MFDDGEVYKKHTTEECLAAALEEIRSNPNLVRMHCNTITAADNTQLNTLLWPGIFDEKNWFRQSTKRPSRSEIEEANKATTAAAGTTAMPTGMMAMLSGFAGYGGTDLVVRTYVNELWEDYTRKLEVIVSEQKGELTFAFDVAW